MKIKQTLIRIVNQEIGSVKAAIAILTSDQQKIKNGFLVNKYFQGSSSEEKIRHAMRAALNFAHQRKVKSVAFPSFPSALIPLKGVAKIMAQEVLKFIRYAKDVSFKEIIFCLPNKEEYKILKTYAMDYLDYMIHKMEHGPYVTVDLVIETAKGLVIIERHNPPYGWALPGGFVDYGETLEHAAIREAKEETNLDLVNVRQLKAYSDPNRDPRFHTITVAFVAQGKGIPKSGDDAKDLKIIPFNQLLKQKYSFDHKQIVKDYLKSLTFAQLNKYS